MQILTTGVMAASLGTSGCEEEGAPLEEGSNTSLEEIAEAPARFYGKTVSVFGEVDEVYSDNAFLLEGRDILWDEEVPVLTRSPVRLEGKPLREDDRLVVTGTVYPSMSADVERDLGWDLTSEIEVHLQKTPIVLATDVTRVEDLTSWSEEAPEGVVVSLTAVITSTKPEDLVGERVELDHALVQGQQGKGLWLGNSQRSQVFVVPEAGSDLDLSSYKPGARVDLTGMVMEMPQPTDALKQWDLPRDVKEYLEKEPVFVRVTKIEKSTGFGKEEQ
jgi:hypothetical protein